MWFVLVFCSFLKRYQLGKRQFNYLSGIWVRILIPIPLIWFDHPVILDRKMSFLSCFLSSPGSLGPLASVPLISTRVQCFLHISLVSPIPLSFGLIQPSLVSPVPLSFGLIQPLCPAFSLLLSAVTAWILQFHIFDIWYLICQWQCATISLLQKL